MRKLKPSIVDLALVALLSFLSLPALAGNDGRSTPVRLGLSDTHTLVLSFPTAVKYVDFGSADIKGGRTSHPGILHLRAVIPFFDETTASVVTADGAYYSFLLSYEEKPSVLGVRMDGVKNSIVRDADMFTSDSAQVSDIKTAHFVCPERVTDILTGSDSIIADYADGIENIVRCKAASDSFPETTLTLVTDSGYVFPYVVTYSQMPAVVNYDVTRSGVTYGEKAIFGDHSINENEMESLGRKVIDNGEKINTVGAFDMDIVFAMSAVYIKDDILMFRFDLENDSRIDYEVDFLKMYITDKKQGKKTALQEDEIKPVYVYSPSGDSPLIHGQETRSYVLFFRRFTIPSGRVLHIEAFEKNGGRHIGFTISNKEILRARRIDR